MSESDEGRKKKKYNNSSYKGLTWPPGAQPLKFIICVGLTKEQMQNAIKEGLLYKLFKYI